MLHYTKPYTWYLISAVICMILFSLFHASIAWVVRFVLQDAFSAKESSLFNLVYLSIIVTFIGRGLFDFGQEYLMNYVGSKTVRDIQNDLYSHIQGLSLDFFSTKKTGMLISRIINDVKFVQGALSTALPDIVKQPLSILALVGTMFYWDPFLAMIILIVFPVTAVPIVRYGKRVRKSSGNIQSEVADLTSIMHEGITGIRIVKAFSMEEYETQRFEDINNNIFRHTMEMIRNSAIVRPIIEVMAAVGVTFVLWYAINKLNTATFFGFMTAVFLMYEPLKKLSKINNTVQQGIAGGQRVFDVLDTETSIKEVTDPKNVNTLLELTFNNVHFMYNESKNPALHGIEFTIKKGEIVALVGPSGGGKTTLMNLIPRFYDPSSGFITLDDTDIREISIKSLRGMMGMVTQDTILFNDTIRNNIAYGAENISIKEIEEAAHAANAHDFIIANAKGYDTVIGEKGIKLSGGQRQRLAIARAILKNPQLLLLDEATSALDTESERLVQDAINRLMENRTSLVIAHRLSTIIHAHRIYVIAEGRIVESGTHDELLKKDALYKKLYEMQFNMDSRGLKLEKKER